MEKTGHIDGPGMNVRGATSMTRRQNRRERTEEGVSLPPPDRGVRLDWTYMPRRVRSEIERWLGGVVIGAVT